MIETLAGLMLALTALSTTLEKQSVAQMIAQPKIAYAETIILPETITEKISRYAKKYGNDEKLSQTIANCESHKTQFNEDGTVLLGIINPKDQGIYQVNEYWHLKDSQRLQMDIKTIDGNIEYGMWLLKHQGTAPWNASKNCWSSE